MHGTTEILTGMEFLEPRAYNVGTEEDGIGYF